MPIVGTAGHVDHGKSTLVRALTGIDPDRWAEEKARGLTIDLGFAWADIGGHDVGFVDVPGHERFVKNMLAGVGAIDCALFVVAADSGWMPQSEEHAAVLDLLEVDRGVIAVSRIDLVDDDMRELATLDVLDRIEGTTLEGWPIVDVSPITGEGMDELVSEITRVLDSAPARDASGFRMWVDRAFRPSGAGLVVTGTVLEGSVAVGDRVRLSPHDATATVRGIQHHGRSADVGAAGSRTAINLSGAPDDVERGTLVVAGDSVAETTRLLAEIRPARAFDAIPDRGAFHVHVGTASVPAAIRRVRSTDAFVVSLDTRVPLRFGDRLIVRESGRRAVVGGGTVLDPLPVDRPSIDDVSALTAAIRDPDTNPADAIAGVHGILPLDQILRATGGIAPSVGRAAGPMWMSPGAVRALDASLTELAADHHRTYPLRPGIPKSEAVSQLRVPMEVAEATVDGSDTVEERAGSLALVSFRASLDPATEAAWREVRTELERSFDVPRESGIGLDEEIVHFLLRRGDLVRVGEDLAFTSRQVEELTERVAELPDGFTVSEFRDHFGMARRQAVPTLEWLDGIGRTRRDGDGRSVRG